MSAVSELCEMVNRFAGESPNTIMHMSVGFMRRLRDEVGGDEPLTPELLRRIFLSAERAIAELPQVVSNMEKATGRAAAAERLNTDLQRRLAIAERAAGLAAVAKVE
jgi:hypothetical protein